VSVLEVFFNLYVSTEVNFGLNSVFIKRLLLTTNSSFESHNSILVRFTESRYTSVNAYPSLGLGSLSSIEVELNYVAFVFEHTLLSLSSKIFKAFTHAIHSVSTDRQFGGE